MRLPSMMKSGVGIEPSTLDRVLARFLCCAPT
jgi:hypothetical protein